MTTYTPVRERYTDLSPVELTALCRQFHVGQEVEVNWSARTKHAHWKDGFTVVNVTDQRVVLRYKDRPGAVCRFPQSVRPVSAQHVSEPVAENVFDLLSKCETVRRWTPGPDDVLFITGAPNWTTRQCGEAAEWLADYLKTYDIHTPILLLPHGCQIGVATAAEVEAKA